MFCDNVSYNIAVVKVAGKIGDFKTAFLEVFKAVLKKQIAIGFEVNFAAVRKYFLVLTELCGMGKTALVVLESGPGVAEVYVNSADTIVMVHNLGNFVYVIGCKSNVFAFFVVVGKKLDDVTSCNSKHIAYKVDSDKIGIGILQGFVGNKITFSATNLKLDGVAASEEIFPVSFVIAGVFDKEFAGIEFWFCPLLFTHSHIITEKTQYFDYIYY